MTVAAIAIAGALGALSRYGLYELTGSQKWPWVTLVINVVGSFLLSIVVIWGTQKLSLELRIALGTGFLGAFTTFSTFSYETDSLVRQGKAGQAALYVGASIVFGLLASALGYVTAQKLI